MDEGQHPPSSPHALYLSSEWPHPRLVARFLASDRAPRVAWLLGMLLVLPTFAVGFLHDDTVHRVILEGSSPELVEPPWALYDFTPTHSVVSRFLHMGAFPWWTDPDLELRFFRPLSSLSLWLDYALAGRSTFVPHLQTLLWFALLSGAAIAIFRRLLPPKPASVASFLFCLAGAHAIPLSWIAARHAVIGAAFAVSALALHLGYRETGDLRRAVAAPFVLVLGLLSSEIAVCGILFIVLYEAFAKEGALRARALSALPTILVGAAYTIFYVASGYGVSHSGLYLSPFDDAGAFVSKGFVRLLDLLTELYGGLPSVLSQITTATSIAFAAAGVVIMATVATLLYRVRAELDHSARKKLGWLALSTLACVIPVIGGSIGGRMLLVSLVGSSAVLAVAFVRTWDSGGRGARAIVVLLAVLHLGLGSLLRVGIAAGNALLSDAQADIAKNVDIARCGDRQLLVATGADPTLSMFLIDAILFYRPPPPGAPPPRTLSMAAHDQILEVMDDRTFELAIDDDAPRYPNPFERIYRAAPMEVGERFDAGDMHVEILAVEDGLWTRIRARYAPGLAHACLGRWDGETLVVSEVPPPGSHTPIPHHLGPMGL